MTVGIVGLGLIGGSFAKAYAAGGHRVLALEKDARTEAFAELDGSVSDALTPENARECELLLLCVYPAAAAEQLRALGPYLSGETLVIDCCGTKRGVTRICSRIADEYGLTYVGGHPMAGTQYSGYKYARETLFRGAPMVLVPRDQDDLALIERARRLLAPAGFGRFTVTTAQEHDRMIAFTSQLAHLVSNAYVKSPSAGSHKGFSAGSYRDMTRVAWLNPGMWAELFLDNKDYLIGEIDTLISEMEKYRTALEADDREMLEQLLKEGKERKEQIDGR
ncbi:MAG: prephenate dehydrogenase [Lachnospiraceae bacterium]|nr:prephenate dehydrogenase [Lachnospiraceae bacterium]